MDERAWINRVKDQLSKGPRDMSDHYRTLLTHLLHAIRTRLELLTGPISAPRYLPARPDIPLWDATAEAVERVLRAADQLGDLQSDWRNQQRQIDQARAILHTALWQEGEPTEPHRSLLEYARLVGPSRVAEAILRDRLHEVLGVLADCQTESGAYARGREDGLRLALEVLYVDGQWYTDRESWDTWMRSGMLKRAVLAAVIEDLILHPEKWQDKPDAGPGQNPAPEQPPKESGLPPIALAPGQTRTWTSPADGATPPAISLAPAPDQPPECYP